MALSRDIREKIVNLDVSPAPFSTLNSRHAAADKCPARLGSSEPTQFSAAMASAFAFPT
jgi:hypothetical protein